MDIQENTNRPLFVPQTSRNRGVWVLLDYSVPTGDKLCSWVLAPHCTPRLSQHLSICLVLYLPRHGCTTFPLLWCLHVSWGKAWEQPLGTQWSALGASHVRTSATGRTAIPLPPYPWLVAVQPSSCQGGGFQFLAFVWGWGVGTTSLAPLLYLEAKVGPPAGPCVFHMHASGSVWGSERVVAALWRCGELAREPVLVATREL